MDINETTNKFPKLDYNYFTLEQKSFLEKLVKYSGRKTQIKIVSPSNKLKSKQLFIKTNLNFLSVDQQILYNEIEAIRDNFFQTSCLISGFGGCLIFGYFIIASPLTKNLFIEFGKSIVFGGILGGLYYNYKQQSYRESIHKIYLQTLASKTAY